MANYLLFEGFLKKSYCLFCLHRIIFFFIRCHCVMYSFLEYINYSNLDNHHINLYLGYFLFNLANFTFKFFYFS